MSNSDLTVKGFKAGAIAAGIRYKNRLDLGLIVSDGPVAAAGVFTTSKVKAAPVLLDMERIASGRAQAILVNAGIANACTGEEGMAAARQTVRLAAETLRIDEKLVQVCSTGVIGQQLPIEPFATAIGPLTESLTEEGLASVAQAIMTTDTVPKTAVRTVTLAGKEVRIAGIAKGAGMIMPDMATMLSFVLTDAAIDQAILRQLLTDGVATSFNAITIDGDTSTNDTVLLLASGKAENEPITDRNSPAARDFGAALQELLTDLARQIVADGEGATKFVTVTVKGAVNRQQAEVAARTIANSPLVKTAFFGEDANWGRIIAALGRSGADCDQDKVAIFFDDVRMVQDGLGCGSEAEKAATEVLRRKQFTVTVDLALGEGSFSVFTCDFSMDYIKINADYRT